MLSSSVLLCNEITQHDASDLVTVTGDLRLNSLSTDITNVTLPNLVIVGQDLYVADVAAETMSLSFPSLVNVSGDVYFSRIYSETVDLSSLRNVGGDVYFYDLRYLAVLELPALTIVGGQFHASYLCGDYSRCYLFTGTIGIDIDKLESVGSFFIIQSNYYMTSVNASALASVGTYFSFDSNQRLAELSFESLAFVGGYLRIEGCDALITAAFNSLSSVGLGSGVYSYQSTTSCSVSGESEVVCVNDNNALEMIAFRSLDYNSVDTAVSSGHYMLPNLHRTRHRKR